ncbi:FkbM family methyltransferase [Christensenella hongkongensis]|uniref:Methyltransferase, FkbM family domain protein n=2 Tax=Christensenella hongkongensis TaxID=270498 RepID=A0A0M2NCZ6_9FIRM|nr:FkbM family methyltransferase [Christensenella hongkongensis]KKI50389.1 methyltransferase, FkbM family domain protein [Christensenella hongkongensis]TCW31247.1 FkbM family methyltransferase [Christensenella hongkongensis]
MDNPTKRYISQKLNYEAVKHTQEFVRISDKIDLSVFMELAGEEFVQRSFPLALLRHPTEIEVENFRNLIKTGAANPVLAYIILSSDEIPGELEKVNIDIYRKSYKQYLVKRKLRNNKFFRWIHAFFVMPTRTKYYIERSHEREMNMTQMLGQMNEKINKLDQVNRKINKLDRLDEIAFANAKMEDEIAELKQKIVSAESEVKCLEKHLFEIQDLIVKKSDLCKTMVTSGVGGVIAVQLAQFTIGVPSEEWRLAMYLSINGHFEQGSEKCFDRLLKPGMRVLDIGANLGIYSLYAARKQCEVYAFEPTPNIFNLLNENFKMNGFENYKKIHTYNLAVAEKEKIVAFGVNETMNGHNSMFPEGGSKEITVNAVAIDEFLPDLKVDMVKIDVEGAEPFVLEGMIKTIKNNPNIKILMEFGRNNFIRAGLEPENILDQILEIGLKIKIISEETGVLEPYDKQRLLQSNTENLLLSFEEIDR